MEAFGEDELDPLLGNEEETEENNTLSPFCEETPESPLLLGHVTKEDPEGEEEEASLSPFIDDSDATEGDSNEDYEPESPPIPALYPVQRMRTERTLEQRRKKNWHYRNK